MMALNQNYLCSEARTIYRSHLALTSIGFDVIELAKYIVSSIKMLESIKTQQL